MTPQVQRGRRIFLFISTGIVIRQLIILGLNLSQGFANVDWNRGVLLPISIAACVAYLWEGEKWAIGMTAASCIISGAAKIVLCARLLIPLALVTPAKFIEVFLLVAVPTLLFIGLPGALYLSAGLTFLLSPSVRAFFAYQREKQRELELD